MKSDAVSLETVCTCKICNHDRAVDCLKSKCQCCDKPGHSMIMDGIEGFAPARKRQ